MRKIALSIILFFCLLTLCSCSDNRPKRIGSSNQDTIKFHNIDWLTEKKEVEKILDNDFGKDTYTVISGTNKYYYKGTYFASYRGKEGDNNPLLWDIGGYGVKKITFNYYSPDNGKSNYLFAVEIRYEDYSQKQFDDLRYKLAKLYDETYHVKGNADEAVEYLDKNNNKIRMIYRDDNYVNAHAITITYECDDIVKLIEKEQEPNL